MQARNFAAFALIVMVQADLAITFPNYLERISSMPNWIDEIIKSYVTHAPPYAEPGNPLYTTPVPSKSFFNIFSDRSMVEHTSESTTPFITFPKPTVEGVPNKRTTFFNLPTSTLERILVLPDYAYKRFTNEAASVPNTSLYRQLISKSVSAPNNYDQKLLTNGIRPNLNEASAAELSNSEEPGLNVRSGTFQTMKGPS